MASLPPVQEELKLTDEQKSKVETITSEAREKMEGLRDQLADVPAEERMAKARALMTEMGEKSKEKLAEVLDADQMKRLNEIELQLRGYEAFSSEKVHEALNLTDEQKSKVREALSDAEEEMREVRQNAQGDFQAAMADMRKVREDAMNDIKEVLNDDQKSKWQDMIGKPFEMSFGGRGGRPQNN